MDLFYLFCSFNFPSFKKKKKFKDFISIYYLYSKKRYRESGGKPLRVYLMDDNPKILISCHTLIFYITSSAYLKSYTL